MLDAAGIEDVAGNRLDQDADGIAGEDEDDYTASVTIQSMDLHVENAQVRPRRMQSLASRWT